VSHRGRIATIAGSALLATGATFTAIGVASPPDSPQLTGVPSANTKSDGYAPASVLSPQLRQVVIAQSSTALENPSALTSYYGGADELRERGIGVGRTPPHGVLTFLEGWRRG
jgi:hypothetical protein